MKYGCGIERKEAYQERKHDLHPSQISHFSIIDKDWSYYLQSHEERSSTSEGEEVGQIYMTMST